MPPAAPAPDADSGREGCDPSYPDVCIPPPPPLLNCRDIPHRNFRVVPPDPHGFDTDRDGIGCEGRARTS
jgi:micrococcal nuclease